MPCTSTHILKKAISSAPGPGNDEKGTNVPPPRSAAAEAHRLSVAEYRSSRRKLVNNDSDLKEVARKQAQKNDAQYRTRHRSARATLQRIYRDNKEKDAGRFTKQELKEIQRMEEWAAEKRWVQAMPTHMKAGNTKRCTGGQDPGTKDDPKGVWLVLNPNARHPGVGIYNSWPSAEAASSGIRGPGATWFSSVDTAVPAWHARCRLGVHNHPAEPTSPVKAEASDISMASPSRPCQNEEQSPPIARASSPPVHPSQSARVAFAHEYLKMPNHDPNSSCLLIRGRPEITAGTSHQASTPTLDFRTPTRGEDTKAMLTSPFSPTTPTKQGAGSVSTAIVLLLTRRIHRQLDAVGHGIFCSTSDLTKASLVAAGHDVEQARVIIATWEKEEREAARKLQEDVEREEQEAERRAHASAQRLADIAAGVTERKKREEQGRAARLAAIIGATNGSQVAPAAGAAAPQEGGKGKGKDVKKDTGGQPPSPSGSEGYDVGFDDLADLDFTGIDGDYQPSPPRPSFNPCFENGPRDDLGPGNWERH
ncbi:hypothetical protein B0H11DRAFT_1940165 [Mycena galericulata]|nr:hypothetical protein B0H11DRAFT_1940165 [Mycena galericulata]